MSGPQFFETRMGQKFFDGTLPRIASALEQVAERLSPARAFDPGDLVVVKRGASAPREFRVLRSDDSGIHLQSLDGVELTLVVKQRARP